ncbi:MAG: HAD-IIB family hydrolase [Alphaproteobacteria bacterium]|nr:HAD-IIB family hydrolase [Alphaproteobacteria bacterium]
MNVIANHHVADFARATFPELAGIDILMSDLDDTITSGGRLPAKGYEALERLQGAGIRVIIVTGRPAGWCDMIARMWPVDGVIGENGALYYAYDHTAHRMHRLYHKNSAERAADRTRLTAILAETLDRFPAAAVSADQEFRIADIAIDFCEDVAAIAPDQVEHIRQHLLAAGTTAKTSSIHINAWLGDFSKLTMADRVLKDLYGSDTGAVRSRVIYVGDSPNDEPMFSAFPLSVGVANIAPVLNDLRSPPRWITSQPATAGFCQVADALIAARNK